MYIAVEMELWAQLEFLAVVKPRCAVYTENLPVTENAVGLLQQFHSNKLKQVSTNFHVYWS